MAQNGNGKSLESWIWDAACAIRGAKDAPKYKDYILPLIFAKRLCDVFDDEINRIAKSLGTDRTEAFRAVEADHDLVRFFIPFKPANPDDSVWSVIRNVTTATGEQLTTALRQIAEHNPTLDGVINRIDFNRSTGGTREIPDDRLNRLIEAISDKSLGLDDVEPDIIGRSYEYLIRKFAEGSVSSAGEFFTPTEVGFVIARIMDPEPGMTVYDPCCGSAGLLIKCQIVLEEKQHGNPRRSYRPLSLSGQESGGDAWALANMNMIIHDMEGNIERGDTFTNPKFLDVGSLRRFDRVVANPMWNQTGYGANEYDNDPYNRFPLGAGFPGNKADWGWVQIIAASLNERGRAGIVLDTGAASRGSGNAGSNKERDVRRWFVEQDLIEGVIYLPENLFYNTSAPGIIIFLNRAKPNERKGKLLLINASKHFAKGTPKNYLTEEGVTSIAATFNQWREEEQFSRIVPLEEIARNDYNISPSRYIHTGDVDEYRPVAEILDEKKALEEEASAVARELDRILQQIAG